MLKDIVEELGADSAAIMIPNIEGRYNYCHLNFNLPKEWINIINSFDETVSGGNVEVYFSGKPAITNHLSTYLMGHYLESVLIVPIFKDNKVSSVLEILSRRKGKSFTKEDVVIAETFAKKLAGL